MDHLIRILIAHHNPRGDRGAGLVEYTLIVTFIAVLCIGSVRYFGGATSTAFSNSGSSMFGP